MSQTTFHFRDSQQAFADAITRGSLNTRRESIRFAGGYMYMHSDSKGDHFKHIDSRRYLYVPRSGPETIGERKALHASIRSATRNALGF